MLDPANHTISADQLGGVSDRPEIEEIDWTNSRTGTTIKIPRGGIDPGWQGGNPGKNRAKSLVNSLNLKLENAGTISPAIPKAIVKELWQSRAPEAYSKMVERVHLPVAFVPKLKDRLDARTPLVVVSSDTIAFKTDKHMHVAPDRFGLVQEILENGVAIDRGGSKGLTFWKK